MFVSQKYRSPHFQKENIKPEFVVLHYTALSLKESLKIFLSSNPPELSCHLLIDEEGEAYELVNCWNKTCYKAFHAGYSLFVDCKGKKWENFNHFSIGIELINWNGNIFHFTESQYETLFKILSHLKSIYPELQNPERIVGHEHIAGFRGKSDPGYLFDWPKLFKSVYPDHSSPRRIPKLTKKQYQSISFLKKTHLWNDKKSRRVSSLMETSFPFFLKRLFFWGVIKGLL